ncbi:MAG: bifunctional metallophosphatase/5'-nucleotidase [Bacteroidales bacterium]|nr:bifunctional metallophosphatase/5'-nucleotidase [Bacteroidales bacterium]
MRHFSIIMLMIPILMASCSSKDTTALTFVETTDTHGTYHEMANDAMMIHQLRNSLGDHLILLDNGDNLQGSPYQYFSNHDAEHPNVAASVLNYFPYDVVGVGNHDIEAGRPVFDRLFSEVKMPVVCANVIDESTGQPYWKPYVILNRDGFKIAVLGLLTPYVVTWVPERLRPGLRFEQSEAAAAHWARVIREKEHPDLLVGLFHSGWEPQEQNLPEDAPLGRENATKWIAEHVPGFDLIFYGHDHRARAEKLVNAAGDTVYVLNAGARGANLAMAEVVLSKKQRPKITVSLAPTDGEEEDAEFLAMLQPYMERARQYQEQEVAVLPVKISPEETLKGSCLWVDEIHRCQFDVVEGLGIHADISLAAPLSLRHELEPGMLTVADFFKWYPFENSLAVVEMSGRDVKAHLEYSYEMRNTIYNYDCAAGIRYVIDSAKPYGERVSILSMEDGSPFELDKTYRVVLNSYRSMGGGNHFVNGCGWAQDDIAAHRVWNSEEDLRSLFVDWAKQKGTLDESPLGNWSVR